MGELQAQLATLDDQLEVRSSKVEEFVNIRESQIHIGQQLAVKSALELATLGNSMQKMRENLSHSGTLHWD